MVTASAEGATQPPRRHRRGLICPSESSGRGWRDRPGPTYFGPQQRRIGGTRGEQTRRRPPAQILGHIGRGVSHDAGRNKSRYPQPSLSARRCPRMRLCGPSFVRTTDFLIDVAAAVLDRLRAMRRPGESFDYEFAAEPSLLHRERLDGGQQLGLSPITLNLINPHVGDARLPESERYGGLRRNVDHSATDERPSANDRDHHAPTVVEVDDSNLRPH